MRLSIKNLALFQALIDFLLPRFCLLCQNINVGTDEIVCNSCWQSFLPAGSVDSITKIARSSLRSTIHFDKAFSLWAFENRVQTLIHHFKYSDYWLLAKPIGRLMAEKLFTLNFHPRDTVLVPIPLHKTRQRERGYNQSELICQFIEKFSGIPFDNSLIKRIRYTKTQTNLNAEQRIRNVSGAFQILTSKRLAGKTVILVDDVLTTGATTNACAQEIRKLSPNSIFVFTAAKA